MKQLIYALCLFPVLTLTVGCQNANERLSAFTDIDIAGTNAEVSYIRRDDLDQWAYKILVQRIGGMNWSALSHVPPARNVYNWFSPKAGALIYPKPVILCSSKDTAL